MEKIEKAKFYFWLVLDILVAVSVFGLVFVAIPALRNYGASLPAARTVIVSAEGKTTAAPDLATVSFSVISQGKNPDELSQTNNEKMSAAVQFVKAQGIDEKDIKTVSYNLQPDYRYDRNINRSFIVGYTLTQTVEIKVRDFSKTAKIIGGLTPLGINQIGGVNFSIEDQEKFLSVARKDAIAKAKAKALQMAAEAGASLGRAISVSESPQIIPIPYAAQTFGAAVKSDTVQPSLEPGAQEIKIFVTLAYELK